MKILFLTRGFPSEENPMSGNYEAAQARAIAAKGHEVSMIAIHWFNPLRFIKYRRIRVNHRVVDGIHIYECDRLKLSIPHVYFLKIEHWTQKWQFKRIYDRYVREIGTPDIVHAHIIMIAAPAIYLKQELHLPFVITEHWTVMNKKSIPKRIMEQTIAYRSVDRVICVSDALAANLKEKCNINSLVINNMVSDQFFKSQKIERHDHCFRFIAVGAMRKNKRFDILVEAFALAHFPENISLDIVGDGVEHSMIESKINQYQLSKQIRLLGVKTPTEVNDLLCLSDCFVLSSRLETFAIVLIEAMAKGLPVIATRSGGPETFVRSEDGVLVAKENVEELSEAMKYMIEHYHNYDAEEIRRHCYDNFSQDVISNKIIEIYKQVTTKNNYGN